MLGWAEKTVVVELPGGGEVSEPHPGRPAAGFGSFDLDPEQAFEELGVTDIAVAGCFEPAGQRLGCGRQFQVGEMTPQLLVDRVWAHRRPRPWFCRSM